jgi:hypothetical protein
LAVRGEILENRGVPKRSASTFGERPERVSVALAAVFWALVSTGCATAQSGAAWSLAPAPSDYSWPPKLVENGASTQPGTPSPVAARSVPGAAEAPFAGVESSGDCPRDLERSRVPYRRVDARRGVELPVEITGPVAGVRFTAIAGLPLVVDCRMARTLAGISPIWARHGIVEVRYSGAYVYRNSRVGRLSLHAYGLALDVHEVVTGAGEKLSVKRDFQRAMGPAGCEPGAPTLNRVACELKRTGEFRELLTPDFNADHRDHFHIAIAPRATDATVAAR